MAVKWCGASTGQYVLDVCCGSGDLAFRLAEAVGPAGQVIFLILYAARLHLVWHSVIKLISPRFNCALLVGCGIRLCPGDAR